MFSFARNALLWLAAAAVKVQDGLATLGLDGPPRQPLSEQRKTSDMNLLNLDLPSHGRPMRLSSLNLQLLGRSNEKRRSVSHRTSTLA